MHQNDEIFAGVFDNIKQHCLLMPPVNLNNTLLQNLNKSLFPKIKKALFICTTNEQHIKVAWHALKWRLNKHGEYDLLVNKEKNVLGENDFSRVFTFDGLFDPKGKDSCMLETIKLNNYDVIFFTCNEVIGQSYFSWINRPILNYENISDLISMLPNSFFIGIDKNFMIWFSAERRLPALFSDCLPKVDFSKVTTLLYPDEVDKLYNLARGLEKNATIVEIGAYKGGSSIILALGLKESGDSSSKLYSIDPDFHPEFYINIESYEVKDIIVPLHMESGRAVEEWPDKFPYQKSKGIDLLFIDGNHVYDNVCQDILLWGKFLKPGSIIAIHDYAARKQEFYFDVVKATYELLAMRDGFEIIELVESLLIAKKL